MSRSRDAAAPAEPIAPPPRTNPDLLGHQHAEVELRRLFDSGRMPHALLLSGPRGIGKATLAFRLARFVLAQSGGEGAGPALFGDDGSAGLAIPPDSGVFRRVASGGHADLLTVERAYDPRRRRLRTEIVVDDTREIGAFLRLTPAEGGWRVVIVDGADEMNRNAANALLKILEEPPRRALLLLVAHSPGRLLPTIRSRCRRFPLAPLPGTIVAELLARHRPDLEPAAAAAVTALAEGSIGRALDLADRLVRPEAEEAYRVVEGLVGQMLARLAIAATQGEAEAGALPDEGGLLLRRLGSRAPAARWAALRGEIEDSFARTDALNLDRKQTILGAFFAIERAAG
jgi:DNA polymerase-3 subunit delta'